MAGAGAGGPFSDRTRLAWLRLIRSDNVGPVTFRQLINRFGSAEAALDALPRLSARSSRGRPIVPRSQAQAEDELAALDALGGRMLALGEPGYPPLLRHIAAPPPLLAVLGGCDMSTDRTIALVGARNASAAGRKMAERLAGGLGDAGYLVVSGLARGIDTAAHRAALGSGTIAVLAGGLDRIYPDENLGLAQEIVARGGALISEMPLGWTPRAQDFPRRNRLVSGLSLGVVVVEAAKRSGSLITARLALEQDREVFAVPGSPVDPRAEGCNHLIRQGAALVTSADDVIEGLGNGRPRLDLFADIADPFEPAAPGMVTEPDDGDRETVWGALGAAPIAIDDLIRLTGLSASIVQGILLEFDLDGRLDWAGGQMVSRLQ